jgi:hypothetical protein
LVIFLLDRFNLRKQTEAPWRDRAALAVQMLDLTAGASVADLGCGDQKVRAFLPPGISYSGFDLDPQGSGVRRLNLATDDLQGRYDAALCLGVLEYIADIRGVLAKIAKIAPTLVVSHVKGEDDYFSSRLSKRLGWTSVLTTEQFEDRIEAAGWSITDRRLTPDRLTNLWLCRADH